MMSGWIPTARYMREPRAEQYRTCFMKAILAVDFTNWLVESWIWGSIGIESGYMSVKLYLASMALMNGSWEMDSMHQSWLHVTFMLRSQLIGPRSVILKHIPILALKLWMSSFELLVTVQSLTWEARSSILQPIWAMKTPQSTSVQ